MAEQYQPTRRRDDYIHVAADGGMRGYCRAVRGGVAVIELLIVGGGIVALCKGLQNMFGGDGPLTADSVDAEEREFFKKSRGRHSDQSMLEYLNWKSDSVGFPRRSTSNQDIVTTLRNGSKR